jgi:peroxiredoxin
LNGIRGLAALPLLGALAVVGCQTTPSEVAQANSKAPPAIFASIENQSPVAIEDLLGDPVLLEFWATWCTMCTIAKPAVESINREFSPKGLKVMAVTSEDASKVKTWLKDNEMAVPIYLDANGVGADMFQVVALPHAVVIDRKGSIVWRGDPRDEASMREAVVTVCNE